MLACKLKWSAISKRGWKELLRDTWLSVFNFRERWKYEIKTRELWLVCLSWYVNFNLLPDIRDFQLIFSWNSFNWRQILQGRQWIFKWTFKKNSKAGYLTSFSQWLTKPCSEPFSIFSTRLSFFNAFIAVMVNVSWQQQGRLGSYTSPYGTMYTIFPWPI